jgi:hypothetical protein
MVTKELRRFVENGISNLRTFLNRDPARAKSELQSHLREIRITPNREPKEEWHYVAGKLELGGIWPERASNRTGAFGIVVGACNHPNLLVTPFRTESIRPAA